MVWGVLTFAVVFFALGLGLEWLALPMLAVIAAAVGVCHMVCRD